LRYILDPKLGLPMLKFQPVWSWKKVCIRRKE
jgi:hypothetical protein